MVHKNAQGWTVETLYTHLMALIQSNDLRYEQRFEGQQKAVDKVEDATTERFKSVNEFRGTLADQQRILMPRAEAEAMFKSLDARIGELKDAHLAQRGKNVGVSEGWGWAVGVIGLVTAVVSLIAMWAKT